MCLIGCVSSHAKELGGGQRAAAGSGGTQIAAGSGGRRVAAGSGGTQIVAGSGGTQVAAGSGGTPRAPKKHRAAGSSCPRERSPGSALGSCGAALLHCSSDSECTAGMNGRCVLATAGPGCDSNCSYDGCFSDSNCPSNQPCACRSSASSDVPNTCMTGGNCRVDADCGAGGYCSPSQTDFACSCPSTALCEPTKPGEGCFVNNVQVSCLCGDSCGHGYFCHTPTDTCTDDSDCSDGTCSYDRTKDRWSCAACIPVL
jgi:hypothetical protein